MGKEQDAYQKEFEEMTEQVGAFIKDKATEEDMSIMGKAAKSLTGLLPSPGLKVGSAAPDFTLSDAFGSKVTLSDELKNGPVILVFYRGSWCPVCNMHLNALQSLVPMLESKYNAKIIAVTPQQPDESKKQLDKTSLSFKVCSDLEDSVMKSYNLYFELDPDLNTVYKKLGIDVKATNGGDRLGLPVPGTFIIDNSGIVKAMQADTNYMNRMGPDEIIAGLDAI